MFIVYVYTCKDDIDAMYIYISIHQYYFYINMLNLHPFDVPDELLFIPLMRWLSPMAS